MPPRVFHWCKKEVWTPFQRLLGVEAEGVSQKSQCKGRLQTAKNLLDQDLDLDQVLGGLNWHSVGATGCGRGSESEGASSAVAGCSLESLERTCGLFWTRSLVG